MNPTEEQLKAAFEAGVEHSRRKGTFLWAVHESMEREVRRVSKDRVFMKDGVMFLSSIVKIPMNITPEDLNATDWEVCK